MDDLSEQNLATVNRLSGGMSKEGYEASLRERYRLLRLEFIKAAMQGILAHQNYDFPPEAYAQWAVRHAEATLAAAGEKGP